MRELILHIGAAKCGSSSIQRMLAVEHEKFVSHGYFPLDKNFGIKGPFVGHQLWMVEELARRPNDFIPLFRVLHQYPHETTIISSENLCNYPKFPRFLKEHMIGFDRIRVIMYIRRQDDFLISAWQQWGVKEGIPFNQWIEKNKERFANWDRIIKHWIDAFGKEAITVRPLNRLHQNDACRDFLQFLGLGPIDFKTFRHNMSFNDDIVDLAECNNVFEDHVDEGFYRFAFKLLGRRALREGPSWRMSLEQRLEFYEQYRECNDRVKEWFFPGLTEPLFPLPTPADVTQVSEMQKLKRQNRLIARMLYEASK